MSRVGNLHIDTPRVACFENEPFLFSIEISGFTEDTIGNKYFISTGDGGFQIFKTPFHALTFLIYFQKNIHSYNTHSFLPNYHQCCGEISLRYDYLYSYNNNFYGKAIIKNARILSKDKLNRILIDTETYTWFVKKINGIESLNMINNKNVYGNSLKEIFHLDLDKVPSSYLFGDENKIRTSICQKLTAINIKNNPLSIYNLYLQIIMTISKTKEIGFVVPAGNLNLQGIDD